MSKPNEWVVVPINDKKQFMGPKEYHKFIKKLQQKYPGISFKDNLTVASFAR